MQRIARAVLLVSIVVPSWSAAQACTNAQAAAKEGRWVTANDVDPDVARLRREFPPLASAADRAIALLQQAVPTLRGVDASVRRGVNARTLTGTGHVRLSAGVTLFSWYCVPSTGYAADIAGTVRLGDESSTSITIAFNSLGELTNERRQVSDLRTAGGKLIFHPLVQRDSLRGEPLYVPGIVVQRSERALVLTRDGGSPWRPLTRDALLGARIARLQARLDTLRAMPAARAALGPLESELAALVSARTTMPAADLERQAIVKDPYAPAATLFTAADAGGEALVILNRDLLQRGRPKTEVGLITVTWHWKPENAAEAEFIRQFTERIDLVALRQQLTRP